MKLPHAKHGSGIRTVKQVAFGGMNHTKGATEGELFDMENLTGDHYPLLASRKPRAKYRKLSEPGGIYSWEGLCWVDGTDFCYRGETRGKVTPGKKVFASMGRYIVIFPDKCWFDVDTLEFGSLESTWQGESLAFEDGLLYGEEATANTIYAEGADWKRLFREGDAVTISGCTVNPKNNTSIIIRAIDGDRLYFYEHSFTLGPEGESYTETGDLRISRTVPDLKYLCENENRLWGCTDDTIYASKLGDIFNWNVYDGLDSDSYAVDTGSAGKFTGCISYQGYPTFLKEDHIYKVYGSAPSNYDVLGSATMGLAAGSENSLAVAGEILFWLGRNGITAYTGGVPQNIAAVFGTERYAQAAAGSDGLKYYVSMQDQTGCWGLFVYDTRRGLWHKEDDLQVTRFANDGGRLYMLTAEGDILISDARDNEDSEDEICWFAEFADFTDDTPAKKRTNTIHIRIELTAGAWAEVKIMFDSDGIWRNAGGALCAEQKRSFYLPVRISRCDHYRVRIEGQGEFQIHSLTREYSVGSLK